MSDTFIYAILSSIIALLALFFGIFYAFLGKDFFNFLFRPSKFYQNTKEKEGISNA